MQHSAVMKEQNQGLAAEFSGYQFKPQMNKKSQVLYSFYSDCVCILENITGTDVEQT